MLKSIETITGFTTTILNNNANSLKKRLFRDSEFKLKHDLRSYYSTRARIPDSVWTTKDRFDRLIKLSKSLADVLKPAQATPETRGAILMRIKIVKLAHDNIPTECKYCYCYNLQFGSYSINSPEWFLHTTDNFLNHFETCHAK